MHINNTYTLQVIYKTHLDQSLFLKDKHFHMDSNIARTTFEVIYDSG